MEKNPNTVFNMGFYYYCTYPVRDYISWIERFINMMNSDVSYKKDYNKDYIKFLELHPRQAKSKNNKLICVLLSIIAIIVSYVLWIII